MTQTESVLAHLRKHKRAKPKFAERSLHGAVGDLLRLYRTRGTIALHVPNEGRRSPREGAFLKRMMMLPGAPDFSITTLGGKQHWLELKSTGGRQSPEQKAFEAEAKINGSPYRIARTLEEAAAILYEWQAISVDPLAKPYRLSA